MKVFAGLFGLAAVCTAAQTQAQQTSFGSGAGVAAASPYIQQRSQSYTSFDNPYAPGGIYDPYRSTRALSQSLNSHSSLLSGTGKNTNDEDPGDDAEQERVRCQLEQSPSSAGGIASPSGMGSTNYGNDLEPESTPTLNRPSAYGAKGSRCANQANPITMMHRPARATASHIRSTAGSRSGSDDTSALGAAESAQQEKLKRLQQLP